MQLKSVESLGAAEGGARLVDGGFKILLRTGLDFDLGDFGDHWGCLSLVSACLTQPPKKKKRPFGALVLPNCPLI